MSIRFSQCFTNPRVILPVIHVATAKQALHNTAIARDCGCDGVFLINHSVSQEALMSVWSHVRQAFPDFWIGLNCLGSHPVDLWQDLPLEVQGIWMDNAGIDERASSQATARIIATAILNRSWSGLYFGGVAFKYQRGVENLARAAEIAAEYMDVVTTSGPGTGAAASVDKVREMKQAIVNVPLALASGITPENVSTYMPWVDAFLVATGISRSFTELDPTLVERLVSNVRKFQIDSVS